MSNRTNFVKVENLPPYFNDGRALVSHFTPAGDLQDVTPVGPTSVILSFMRRSGAENSVFAFDGTTLGGNVIRVTPYYNRNDPQFFSNPVYQQLGQYIGQDSHLFNPSNFTPWPRGPSNGMPAASSLGSTFQSASGFASLLPSGGMLNNLLPASFSNFGASSSSSSYNPPPLSNGVSQVVPPLPPTLEKYTVLWTPPDIDTQDQCAICLCELGDKATYDKTDPGSRCLSLSLCGHTFHQACLEQLLLASPTTFLQCPTCKKVYGTKSGNMPTSGTMSHRLSNTRLPGHEKVGCIEITFTFSGGTQGPEHPNPGQHYHPVGFPRTAYLPDSPGGLEMLHGLYLAWEQRVMFTVGTSITTGRPNCVTWNDIHVKTIISSSEHGYPDPQHLSNLAADLANHGITQATISSHMTQHPDLRKRGHI